jgi:hypothetical protein
VHLALGAEAVPKEDVSPDLRAVGAQRILAGVLEASSLAVEVAPDVGPEKAHLALGGKTFPENDVAINVDAGGANVTRSTAAQIECSKVGAVKIHLCRKTAIEKAERKAHRRESKVQLADDPGRMNPDAPGVDLPGRAGANA